MIIDLNAMFKGVKQGSGFGTREFNAPTRFQLTGLGEILNDPLMSAGYIDQAPFDEAAAFNGSQSDPTTADFYAAVQGQGT